jgi:hypothetical protein
MSLKGNVRALCMALAAVFAFGALAASAASASAPHFTITTAGGAVDTALEQTFTAESTGDVALVQAAGITLTSNTANGDCTSTGTLVGVATAGVPSTAKNTSLTCKNVKVFSGGVEQPKCTVHSPAAANGTITTNTLKQTLVWLAETGDTKVGATFAPAEGTTFVTVEITGAECAIAGKLNVTGNTIAEATPVTEHVTSGTLQFPTTAVKTYWTNQTPTRTKDEDAGLKLGASNATFSAHFTVKLCSDLLWGIEPF